MALDAETRAELHKIRDMIAEKFAQVDVNSNGLKETTQRLDRLEELFEQHVTKCDSQETTLRNVEALMQNIQASYTVSNMIRRFIIFMSPLVAAAYGAWQWFRGSP